MDLLTCVLRDQWWWLGPHLVVCFGVATLASIYDVVTG